MPKDTGMTAQEAIRILKTEYLGDSEQMELAKQMGALALEKQIPKKPEYDENTGIYICPNCRSVSAYDVDAFGDYCENCGQAIKKARFGMKIIYGSRQSGRTTELIKMCAQDNYSLIVCPSRPMCEVVFKLSKELGYKIPMPITFKDFTKGLFYSQFYVDKFYFDDIESCLEGCCGGGPIGAVVLNSSKTEIIELKKTTKIKINKKHIKKSPAAGKCLNINSN